MTDVLVLENTAFAPLTNDELMVVDGGGILQAIAVGAVSACIIGLTIAVPPLGISGDALVLTCVGEGLVGIAAVVGALRD